ncbi:SRPBCC family protein [Mycobacteroides salmoniphilum]|uniref:SRPBCC family protein n=1 Tax=Mycobacteroides salmoniphilum TaxID=404941 RepID=UPI0012FF9801|nr:SRPBCC family protein [Mycobacteroides salmoniphilum]
MSTTQYGRARSTMVKNPLRRPAEVLRTETAESVRDEYSVQVSAPPEQLWDMVSDITRMGRFSPENRAGWWLKPSAAPAVNSWFIGVNRIGPVIWATPCRVTALDPGRHFEFKVSLVGTVWGYYLDPAEDGGVMITEYREWPRSAFLHRVLRWSGPFGRPRDVLALNGLHRSLQRIKETTEG